MGVRLFSKEDVLLYVEEMKVTECDTDGQCDTNSRDNILALVEFNPSALPQGWVKELVYRKTKEGMRKDPHDFLHKRLTNNWKDAKTPTSLPKPRGSALREKTDCNGQASYSKDTDSDTSTGSIAPNELQNIKNKSMEAEREQSSSAKTIKRPRGRPPKVAKENSWNTKKARTKR
ncbi:hypothetical protein ACQ4PT_067868 [Festuca glaucescens]